MQWYDEEGRVRYWNPASETIYGWKAAETLGRTLDGLILAPEDAAQFRTIIDRVRTTGRPSAPYEMRIRRRNGQHGWVLATTYGMPLGAGKNGFVCMDVDITERKQVEAALGESEIRLRTLSDNLPGGLVYQIDSGKDGQEARGKGVAIANRGRSMHASTAKWAVRSKRRGRRRQSEDKAALHRDAARMEAVEWPGDIAVRR